MKTLIRKYIIQKWWIPTIFFFTSIFLFFFASYLEMPYPHLIGVIGLLFLLVSSILQLFNKKWLPGILNFGISIGTVVVVIGFLALVFIFGLELRYQQDTFADSLDLPKNVKLDKPIDLLGGDGFELHRPESTIQRNNFDFQLYASFQPGLYEYDFWTNKEMRGVAYLKVFEITQEVQLSEFRLAERSSIRIENINGELKKYGTTDNFTIYEGDWGKPYGARFELWFKPDGDSFEKKILEKNYIVEGWMR